MTGEWSAGSYTCFARGPAGVTVLPLTAPIQRSTTASIAGAGRASGSPCSRRSPAPPASPPRCRSTAPTSRRTAQLPGQKGAFAQAIGNSRGGRTTKIHAVADAQGRPRLILLTPGNASDMATAPLLLRALPPITRGVADRGYDSNALRALIAQLGAEAVIPPSSDRVRQIPYDRLAYR